MAQQQLAFQTVVVTLLRSKILHISGMLILASLFSLCLAQGHVKPEQRAELLTETMMEELGLSSDKRDGIYTLNFRYVLKNDSVNRVHREDSELTRYLALQEMQEAKEAELEKLLNTAQFEAYGMKKWLIQKRAVDKMELAFYHRRLGITGSQEQQINNLNDAQNKRLAELNRKDPGKIELYLFFRQAGKEKKALQEEIFTGVQLRVLEESRDLLRGRTP